VAIVVGLLLAVGSAINAATRPDDRLEFAAYSAIGVGLLIWGMIKSNRGGASGDDSDAPKRRATKPRGGARP
jgi:hypothetical protein